MDIDAGGEKESPDEDKGVENGKMQISVQVGELKVDVPSCIDKHGSSSGLQGSNILQVQQQQSQGTGVCWERFLHLRSIRVMLVENDDSTRHIVTALLRNCNYDVLQVANGLQAWKILEDLNNHIDIVLTEVVMPCLSGIGLLCKIMSHKSRKNIPVIMMSSHDSMGLVFQCLSKGAVDFLVKPIRKNELKNLWQHVWRRCHSSSGSGSESGTQTQKSVKSKESEQSGNCGSDDGENDASNGLNIGDGSDDGSGAQSSWTKLAVEVNSSQALSPVDQVDECQNSTCAQVIRSNAENSDNEKVQISVAREGHGDKLPDAVEKCKDMEPVVHRKAEQKSEKPIAAQHDSSGRESDSTREAANKLDENSNASNECKEPNLELSLKRLRGVQDTGRSVQDDRYVLRRSEQSAFSRYNTSANAFKTPNGFSGSNSVLDNSTEVAKRESVSDMQMYSAENIIYQCSNGVGKNNIDMGSTTNKQSEATSTIKGAHSSSFRPVKNEVKLLQNGIQPTELCPVRVSNQDLQVQNSHQHHHHNHFNSMENQASSNHDESLIKKLAVDAPHCGSTNVIGRTADGNTRNYSLNRSASGSNHGSNGQNGSSTALNTVGNNAESDVGQAGKSGRASGDVSDSGNRVDENKFAQREAALLKFRQKRKERCFTKRVRYQNRKKLAEQRSRVRGQFAKQTGTDSSNKTDCE